MDNEISKNDIDSRYMCKYGTKCYQKSEKHHKRYKHPPKPIVKKDASKVEEKEPSPSKQVEEIHSPARKKLKVAESEETKSHDKEALENKEKEPQIASDSDSPVLPPSPVDVKENIKQKFLLDMPLDFYDFWKFCEENNGTNPENALVDVGLTLVGPYDVLSGKLKPLKDRNLNNYLCHWRYYYDPPEFQTVIAGSEDEFHIGYFRDDPSEDPVFAASMCSTQEGIICPTGDNLFASISVYINSKMSKVDPFKKTLYSSVLKKIEVFAANNKYSLDTKTDQMKQRQKNVVAKSFHNAGIVVPVNKKTDVGYREIPETTASLKKMLKKVIDAPTKEQQVQCFVDVQELITNAQWATDEGDFGMGLELGIDLFVYGGDVFHSSIKHLLTVAYELLNRQQFALIIKAHLQNRRKGANMSIV